MDKKSCSRCIFFKPHIYFPYIGFCIIRDTSVVDNIEICNDFKPSSLDELKRALAENGWLYCVTCRKIILSEEELEKHIKEHFVTSSVFIDDVIAEETPAGD